MIHAATHRLAARCLVVLGMLCGAAQAQLSNPTVTPNPYTAVPGIRVTLPYLRPWGVTSTVYNAGDGKVWAAARCGGNTNSPDTPEIDPVLLIEAKTGKILKTFGRNLIVWPHG